MIAIIAENSNIGKDIARLLGANEKRAGYLSGNGYLVTWTIGALIEFATPEEYGINSFQPENLPVIPETFKYIPRQIKTENGYKPDKEILKQLKAIQKVFEACREIIVATEPSGEGELTFRNLYQYFGCDKPFSRLWINSLTEKAIQEGLENLRPGNYYDNLYLSARLRSEADWMIGVNASQALCLTSGEGNNSLGRVQTPVLSLICSRYLENRQFKPQPYWQLALKVEKGEQMVHAFSPIKMNDKTKAGKLFHSIPPQSKVIVTKVEETASIEHPPLLHNLTSLQIEANIRYGFSSWHTLSIAQNLYESKYITFPRTPNKYISTINIQKIPNLIELQKDYPELSVQACHLANKALNQRVVNDKKATGQTGLTITEKPPVSLDDEAKLIYELIAGRMLEAFSEKCIRKNTTIEFTCKEFSFEISSSIILKKGWKSLFEQQDDNNSKEPMDLPVFSEGETLPMGSLSLLQRNTVPNPLFTEASLLEEMENTGLGIPFIRAEIIESLFERDSIERYNQFIYPTDKGLYIYNAIKHMRISDVETAALWEKAFIKIEKKPQHMETFREALKIHTKQLVDEIISLRLPGEAENLPTCLCPACKTGKILFYSKIAKCTNSVCKRTFFREQCGKMLTDNQLMHLLKKGRSPFIKGFKNQKGNTFDAFLLLDEKQELVFESLEIKS